MSTLSPTGEDLRRRWNDVLMNNYTTPPVELVRGEGARVWDASGKEYLDLLGGIAVNILGHAHPAVVAAVRRQITVLGHTSNLVINPLAVELAETLLGLLSQPGRVMFCNSGTEANETALKMSRRTGRTRLVAAEGSFHGRTMGALALTGDTGKRQPFAPLPPEVDFVPYGNVDALSEAVCDDTAALFLEPVQGEAGVVVPPDGYLEAARRITHEHGALLVIDEVQTGIGRTGRWFAHQASGIVPDVVTMAKGLGGGLPLGACVGIGAAGDLLRPGQHGTTFGGNPVCCAAGLAVLGTLADDGLLDRAECLGAAIRADIGRLGHPLVGHVDAAGLLVGITLHRPLAFNATTAARNRGFLIGDAGSSRMRLAPPAVVTDTQVERFVSGLSDILEDADE